MKLIEELQAKRSPWQVWEHFVPTVGDASIFAYATRVGCCGCCSIKVERDEDRFRIGRLSLAPYCHLALLVFGLCFLLAGAVLTGLAYSHPQQHAPLIYSQLKVCHQYITPLLHTLLYMIWAHFICHLLLTSREKIPKKSGWQVLFFLSWVLVSLPSELA